MPQVPQVPQLHQGGAITAMAGGAFLSSEPSVSSTVLIFSVVLIAFSGYVFYTLRKTLNTTTEKDDPPPNPNPVRKSSDQRF